LVLAPRLWERVRENENTLLEHDRDGSQPVVVITEELARQAWPGEEPIGRRLRRGGAAGTSSPWMTVVGVVSDVKEDNFNFRLNRPAWYIPYAQLSLAEAPLNLLVRTTSDPAAAVPAVRAAIRSVDRQLAVSNVQTMTEQVASIPVTERFSAVLMTALASLGLFLAACGLYGVIAYSTSQRTGEIGLRMALGASPRDVLRLVMGQGATVVVIGLVVGLVLARALSAALSGTLNAIDSGDPTTFAAVTILLAAASAAACYLPARRATRVDPIVALRTAN
jgi:putative ABC transport system permease protein